MQQRQTLQKHSISTTVLAHEVCIILEHLQRISNLLSKQPPLRVDDRASSRVSGVAIGLADVIDAAIREAVAAPLQDSMRPSAAERAAQKHGEGRERKEGNSIT